MAHDNDRALIAECRRDPEAFGQLYDRHFDAIFRYILRRAANVAVAEDLTSQTFHKAVRKLWQFRWQGVDIAAWLYRIAGNEVNSHFRREYRTARFLARQGPSAERVDAVAPDTELQAAEAKVKMNTLYLRLNGAIRRLRPLDQDLIVFRYFEQKSFSEISRIVRRREGALRMRAVRALERLEGLLAEEGITHEEYREVAEYGVGAGG